MWKKQCCFAIVLVLFLPLISALSITNGLISHWAWDGNAIDSAGNNNGNINGATFDAGKTGQALSMDGQDDYVKMTSGPDLRGMTSLTMSAWVKASSSIGRGYSRIIEIGTNASTSTAIVLDSNGGSNYIGTVRVWVHTNGSRKEVGTSNGGSNYNYNDDQWHHLAMTYDNSQIKLYIDGALIQVGNASGAIDSAVGTLIGQHNFPSPDNQDTFGGLIDETLVYNRALSLNEIQILASEQVPEPNSVIVVMLCILATGISSFRKK